MFICLLDALFVWPRHCLFARVDGGVIDKEGQAGWGRSQKPLGSARALGVRTFCEKSMDMYPSHAGLVGSSQIVWKFLDRDFVAVTRRDEKLTPYIGRTIADYVLDHGPPTNTVDLGPGKKGFNG